MKQNNGKFIFYALGIVILAGMVFVAAKEISPQTTHVETEIIPQK